MKCEQRSVQALPQNASPKTLFDRFISIGSRQTHTSHAMWVPTVHFARSFIPRLFRFSWRALSKERVPLPPSSHPARSLYANAMPSFEFLAMLLFLSHNQNFIARPRPSYPSHHACTYTLARVQSCCHKAAYCEGRARTKRLIRAFIALLEC